MYKILFASSTAIVHESVNNLKLFYIKIYEDNEQKGILTVCIMKHTLPRMRTLLENLFSKYYKQNNSNENIMS